MDWKVVPYAEVNEALETGASRDENTTKEDVIFELHEIISKLSTIGFSVDYELTLNKTFPTV